MIIHSSLFGFILTFCGRRYNNILLLFVIPGSGAHADGGRQEGMDSQRDQKFPKCTQGTTLGQFTINIYIYVYYVIYIYSRSSFIWLYLFNDGNKTVISRI